MLVDRCNWTGNECDVLGVTTDLRIIDVEIKVSRADFKADAGKDKWWHRPGWRWNEPQPPAVHRDWPPKVWKHYVAMPAELWMDSLFEFMPSPASGLLLVREHRGRVEINCHRRAKPNKDAYRLTPAQAVDVARLANLRMWDAYARLDRRAADAEKMRAAA
ncbi:MAG TPA: hypothetical protein PLB26_15470 [Rubrivivax sp.]|nr:hypothetical protein [Rubrivivax sp.]